MSFMTQKNKNSMFQDCFHLVQTRVGSFEGALSPVFYPVMVMYGTVCSTHPTIF